MQLASVRESNLDTWNAPEQLVHEREPELICLLVVINSKFVHSLIALHGFDSIMSCHCHGNSFIHFIHSVHSFVHFM